MFIAMMLYCAAGTDLEPKILRDLNMCGVVSSSHFFETRDACEQDIGANIRIVEHGNDVVVHYTFCIPTSAFDRTA